jgi:hypothetical protein
VNETELEEAWAAGFFEGEGSVFRHSTKTKVPRLACSLDQTDAPELINRFHRAVLLGKTYGPYGSGSGRLRWRWAAYHEEAGLVLELLAPYLGEHSLKVRRWKELV